MASCPSFGQGEDSTSEYSTDDSSKRKRIENQEAEIFKKSKKLIRTPKKDGGKKQTNEDMEEVKDFVKRFNVRVKRISKREPRGDEVVKRAK